MLLAHRSLPLILLVCVGGASADTVTLSPAKDNTLYESASGDTSNALGTSFFVGLTATNSLRRGVVSFDVSSIPAGSTITAVTLTLFLNRGGSGAEEVTLHRLTADWGNGTSNAGEPGGLGTAATPGDPTWIFSFYATTHWSHAGGDFASAASASQTVADSGVAYTWPSSTALVADAQAWVDNPAQNFGWIVIGDESSLSGAMRFDSREGTNPPHLTITFTPPPQCGSADFNGDGDTGTDADIEAFFACLAGNCCPTCGSVDFNADGDTGTDADIESFFRVLGGGPC